MQRLLGREQDSFTLGVQVAGNGVSIATNALIDTGANGYVFLNTLLAIKLAQFFGVGTIPLGHTCPVRGYDGRKGEPITHAIVLDLRVDGRRLPSTPMLIADLGKHDIILGKEWLAENQVLPDCSNNRLLWPDELPPWKEVANRHVWTLPKTILRRKEQVNTNHQKDADRRDRLITQEDIRTRSHRAFSRDNERCLSKMRHQLAEPALSLRPEEDEAVLQNKEKRQAREEGQKKRKASVAEIDIAMIGGVGFDRHLRKGESEIFVTTLAEIDKIVDERRQREQDDELETIHQELPNQYEEFADVFSKVASDTLPPPREVDHQLDLEGDPSKTVGYSPLYKMSAEELEAAREYIIDNLNKGFIVPSQSPYASPILMARKPGGGLRFCVDYRKLNSITRKDRYPLPLIDEVLERISHAKVFTKLDIRQGFHRIRMHPDSEEHTTFRTRYGSYKYKVMPFGLTNGPATFQRLVNDIFMDMLDEYVTAFVDDLLIYSTNEAEHELHVKAVLTRLRAAGLQASLHKCEFHVTRTKYLGFIVTTEGVEVDPEKVAAVLQWGRPNTVKGVQSFLGFCNFYRRFIYGYSRIAKPLNRLTKKETPFCWTPECEESFQQLKQNLATAPVLRHYRPELLTQLETDASDNVVAAILSQLSPEDGLWHPVGYLSRTMTPAEQNYEIHDKELLAIIVALNEWRAELEGLQRNDRFFIFSDHQALQYFMTTKRLNARQARWAEFLSRFHFVIKYRTGKTNVCADALTRRGQDTETPKDHRNQILLHHQHLETQVLEELTQAQAQDKPSSREGYETPGAELKVMDSQLHLIDRICQANRRWDQEQQQEREELESPWTKEGGLLLHQQRLYVPNQDDLRVRLLDEIHQQLSTAHPGKTKTKQLLKERYYWEGWSRDVERYVDNCMTCKRTNARRDRPPGLLKSLPAPDRPWQHLSMDFCSLPKDKKGYNSIFVIVDRFSKRYISLPCYKTTGAEDMAKLFIEHVYRWKGPPDTIVSDRGGQFVSEFWKAMCNVLHVKLKLSTADHPQTDGQTENANQIIEQRLRPFVNHYQDDWSEKLPMMDFAGALLVGESTETSPFLIDSGYTPRTSFDWTSNLNGTAIEANAQQRLQQLQETWDWVQERIRTAQARQQRNANRSRREVDFDVDDMIMVSTKNWNTGRPSKKLDYQWAGPFRILAKEGNAFRIDLPASIKVHPVINPEHLRRASTSEPLPGQHADALPPTTVNDQNEWEVEEILASRLRYRKLQYRAKWVGYDDDPNWYPARDFKNSPVKLQIFHAANPKASGPPRRLLEWLRAAEDEEYLNDHPDDDYPVPKD